MINFTKGGSPALFVKWKQAMPLVRGVLSELKAKKCQIHDM